MLNSRRLLLNRISMRWHVIYSKRTLWLSNLLSKNTANTPNASSRRVSPRCVCVWQILNGLCLVLLLRKWTWHYSSITTAIPPLISPLFSSLPPLSLRLSVTPISSVFLFPPPALLSFWPFQIFFCLLPSVCSISILCRICLILPLCLSSFHHDSTQLSLRTVRSIFSHFPLLFFLPASIALLFCQSSNLLLSIITLCTILILYLSFKQPCSSAQLFILGLFKCTETSDNMNALAVFCFFFLSLNPHSRFSIFHLVWFEFVWSVPR